eukprot:4322688-Lingulodinium_polyedra.AAC.1
MQQTHAVPWGSCQTHFPCRKTGPAAWRAMMESSPAGSYAVDVALEPAAAVTVSTPPLVAWKPTPH